MTLRSQGWCILTWGIPPEDVTEPIEDAMRRQQPSVSDSSHTSHFHGRFDAFADYSSSEYSNSEYVYRTLLGAPTIEDAKPEPPIVVHWGPPSKEGPYLVGPLDYAPGEALVLIRPIKCRLDLGVYSGSHGFPVETFSEGQMDYTASLLSVAEYEVILLKTHLWFHIPCSAEFVAKVYARKVPEPPAGEDATEEYEFEQKHVVPFMRRWSGN